MSSQLKLDFDFLDVVKAVTPKSEGREKTNTRLIVSSILGLLVPISIVASYLALMVGTLIA